MTDILASVLTLRPEQPCVVPRWLGIQTQAWFLGEIDRYDPALSAALHEGSELRAYTVSSLLGAHFSREIKPLDPAETYALRVTSLCSELSNLLLNEVLPALVGQTLTLVGAPFKVEAVATDAAEHPLAGRTTDIQLVQTLTLSASALPRNIAMRFESPTAFHSKGMVIPFPLPALVFGHLIERWNKYNDVKLAEDARAFAEAAVAVSRHDLRTQHVTFDRDTGGKAALSGFTGYCRYAITQHDRYWVGVLHALAAYAFYSGVGVRTTIGLGRARAVQRMTTP